MSNSPILNPNDGDCFYQLQSKISYGRSPVKIEAFIEYDTLENISLNSPLIENNKFKYIKGTKWFDFLPFNNSFDFAVSKNVKDTLEENNITGLSFFPILIENHEDKHYFCFAVTSIAGKILNLEKLNDYEDDYTEFDINTWDGSDIFNLNETGIFVCTKRVKDILTKKKFTNVEFKIL